MLVPSIFAVVSAHTRLPLLPRESPQERRNIYWFPNSSLGTEEEVRESEEVPNLEFGNQKQDPQPREMLRIDADPFGRRPLAGKLQRLFGQAGAGRAAFVEDVLGGAVLRADRLAEDLPGHLPQPFVDAL